MKNPMIQARQFLNGIGDFFIREFGPTPVEPAQESRRVREVTNLLPGNKDSEWRSLSSAPRDLSPATHTKMLQVAHYLATMNGIARRILGIFRDFTIGDGITFEVKHDDPKLAEEVNAALEGFWNDDVNDLDERLDNWVWELPRDGELILPWSANPSNGMVQLGYIDPRNISEVRINADNPLITDSVVITSSDTYRQRTYRVTRRDAQGLYSAQKKDDGDCLYFAINRSSNATRGQSEIFSIADWLAVLDTSLFNEQEIRQLQKLFFLHEHIEGAGQKEIEAREEHYKTNPPQPGTVVVTGGSKASTFSILKPANTAADTVEFSKYTKEHIAASSGIPPHFLADAQDVNRSTGDSMTDPFNRMLKTFGKRVKRIVERMLLLALHQRVIAGYFGSKSKAALDCKITVKIFEPGRKDAAAIAVMMKDLATALLAASEKAWITDEDASAVFTGLLSSLGYEVAARTQEEIDAGQAEEPLTPESALPPIEPLPAKTPPGAPEPAQAGGNGKGKGNYKELLKWGSRG